MDWEIEFIKLLQRSSSGPADYFFWIITQLGTELIFMVAVMVFYWCVNKREGFKLINLFMASQLVVGIIKIGVKRIRPYDTEKVRPILERTEGYSFPSGHSNNIAVVGIHSALYVKKTNKRYFFTTLTVVIFSVLMVMLSRMYLGQHYLTDVLAGAFIGCLAATVGFYVFDLFGDKEERLSYAIVPCCVIMLAISLYLQIAKGESFETVIKIVGVYMAAAIGYFLEKRFVAYDVKADKAWKYAVRLVLGLIIVLAIKEGLKALFGLISSETAVIVLDFIRYFLMGIFVTLLAPLMFKKMKI